MLRNIFIFQMVGGEELADPQEAEVGAGTTPEVEAVLGVSKGNRPALLWLQRGGTHIRDQHTEAYPRLVD